jgi:hypothetical protein
VSVLEPSVLRILHWNKTAIPIDFLLVCSNALKIGNNENEILRNTIAV